MEKSKFSGIIVPLSAIERERVDTMNQKEKALTNRLKELRESIEKAIELKEGVKVIDYDENYILIAKSVNFSVNIFNNNNKFQPQTRPENKRYCVLSLIHYGEKTNDKAEELLRMGCKIHNVSSISDISWVVDEI